jgi:type II secretory pathway component GspD/PulD (secretin)
MEKVQVPSISLSTRASAKLPEGLTKYLSLQVQTKIPDENYLALPRLNSLDRSNGPSTASPRKSALLSSFTSIFSKFIKTSLRDLDASAEFDEERLDLKKWEKMVKPQRKIDIKKEYAMRRMKSSTLIVRSNQKCKSSIPLVLHAGSPVNHVYVRDASSTLTTQKERTLVQLYNKSTRLQKGKVASVNAKKRLAGLAK